METCNLEIRRRLRAEAIPLWKIGDELGVSEITVCRWLRKPLDADKAKRINAAIAAIVEGGEER